MVLRKMHETGVCLCIEPSRKATLQRVVVFHLEGFMCSIEGSSCVPLFLGCSRLFNTFLWKSNYFNQLSWLVSVSASSVFPSFAICALCVSEIFKGWMH